jgi:D-alanine-D-alanine ligase-like ATP-grasp enzyme
MRALEAIAETTALDYGGIDFGLDAEGNVVVFEANGAMGIFMPDADPRWDYRRGAFSAALDAAKSMIVRRAATNRQPQR